MATMTLSTSSSSIEFSFTGRVVTRYLYIYPSPTAIAIRNNPNKHTYGRAAGTASRNSCARRTPAALHRPSYKRVVRMYPRADAAFHFSPLPAPAPLMHGTALRRPDEMTDSTLLTDDTPSERAGAGEHAGGTNGDRAGGLCQHQHGGTARGPRLGLEIREPFLHLIMSMRAVLNPAADRGAGPEEEEAPAGKNQGRRRLRRVGVRALQVGQRKIARTDEVDIVAKFQYKKPKKIVCQLRRGDAFVKIDILWSNILAMSACFDDERFDTLRIEVKSSSERYRASQPPAGMHLQWQRCTDVTPRTFFLQFDKGTLERGYGKMLYTDPSLLLLTSPPPGQEEEEEKEEGAQATNTQQITAAVPVPTISRSRDAVDDDDNRLNKQLKFWSFSETPK